MRSDAVASAAECRPTAYRDTGFLPPSERPETTILLNVVPQEIRLHRKVAVMLRGPDERYDPKNKSRIGVGVRKSGRVDRR